VYKRNYLFRITIKKERSKIRSCIEIYVTDIKIYNLSGSKHREGEVTWNIQAKPNQGAARAKY